MLSLLQDENDDNHEHNAQYDERGIHVNSLNEKWKNSHPIRKSMKRCSAVQCQNGTPVCTPAHRHTVSDSVCLFPTHNAMLSGMRNATIQAIQ